MREMSRSYVLPMISVLAGLVSSAGNTADLVIQREIPLYNVLEKRPSGFVETVPTSREDLVLGAVPGAKIVGDEVFGDIIASRPSGLAPSAQSEALQNALDPSRGNAASNLALTGSFSSLGGLGGQISGEVGSTVGSGLQGLGGLSAITPGGR